MTHKEALLDRFRTRTQRFHELLDLSPAPHVVIAEEGGLLIDSVVAIAGPDAMAAYARNGLHRALELDGLCPWDHADDRAMHPVIADGMCAGCLAQGEH